MVGPRGARSSSVWAVLFGVIWVLRYYGFGAVFGLGLAVCVWFGCLGANRVSENKAVSSRSCR